MKSGSPVSEALRTAPPGSSSASRTSTSQPRSASRLAATSPFGPAPTTTASGIPLRRRVAVGEAPQRPEDDVLATRELDERRAVQRDPVRRGHRVRAELEHGVLHGPRPVMDVAEEDAPAVVDGVEAGALDEPSLRRPPPGGAPPPAAPAEGPPPPPAP